MSNKVQNPKSKNNKFIKFLTFHHLDFIWHLDFDIWIFKKRWGGFTMIELLVAVSLFVIVISIASGTFVQALRTQRGVLALMAANDNASLALEQMAREIRTGREFSTTGSSLNFINYLNEAVVYDLNSEALQRNGQAITGRNVAVVYSNFTLFGEGVADGRSTRVLINLGVGSRGHSRGFVTPLQTTVSSRILDS